MSWWSRPPVVYFGSDVYRVPSATAFLGHPEGGGVQHCWGLASLNDEVFTLRIMTLLINNSARIVKFRYTLLAAH